VWETVAEDTSAAIQIRNARALNRRAQNYDQLEKNSEAFLNHATSYIIDEFGV
jgi:import receptor subunit TOM70